MATLLPGLPALPPSPTCRDPHALCHATGLDYVIEPVVGAGLVATNGATIDTDALAELAPCFCCPKAQTLTPACDIKQY